MRGSLSTGALKEEEEGKKKNKLTYQLRQPGPFQNPDPRNSVAALPAPGSQVPRFPLQSGGHRLPFPGAVPRSCFGSLQSSRIQVAHLTLPRKLGGTWRKRRKGSSAEPTLRPRLPSAARHRTGRCGGRGRPCATVHTRRESRCFLTGFSFSRSRATAGADCERVWKSKEF